MSNDFAVFIVTHGRAKNQFTYKGLMAAGYSGRLYFLVDDLDEQLQEYKELFGDAVIVFDKRKAVEKADTFFNTEILASVLYARIALEDIARDMGLSCWCEMDDDILSFAIRYPKGKKLKSAKVTDMDKICEAFCKYIKDTGIAILSFGNQSTMIGANIDSIQKFPRKCSNAFFRNASVPIRWASIMYEDMVTTESSNVIGRICGSYQPVSLATKDVGQGVSRGGMQETYKKMDGYSGNFLVLIPNPQLIQVIIHGGKFTTRARLSDGVPQIISGKWKKARDENA